jgi:hypothetical protein
VSLKVFVELIERLKKFRLRYCKPGHFLEEISELMLADTSRGTGLFPEVICLLDFGVRVPPGHNDAILSSQSSGRTSELAAEIPFGAAVLCLSVVPADLHDHAIYPQYFILGHSRE